MPRPETHFCQQPYVAASHSLRIILSLLLLSCTSSCEQAAPAVNQTENDQFTAIAGQVEALIRLADLTENNALKIQKQIQSDLSEAQELGALISKLRRERLAAAEHFPTPAEISSLRSADYALNNLVTQLSIDAEGAAGVSRELVSVNDEIHSLTQAGLGQPDLLATLTAKALLLENLKQIVNDQQSKLNRAMTSLQAQRETLTHQLTNLSTQVELLTRLTEQQGKLATAFERENYRLNLLKLDYDNLRLALLSSRRAVRRDLHTSFEIQRLQWKENETEWLLNASKDQFIGAIKSGRALSLYQLEMSILGTLVDDFLTSQTSVDPTGMSEDDAVRLAFYQELEKTVLIDRGVLEQMNCSLGAAGAKTRLGMRFMRDGRSITLVPRNWPRLFLVAGYQIHARKLSEQLDQIGNVIAIDDRNTGEQARLEALLGDLSRTVDQLDEKRRADQPNVNEGNFTSQGNQVAVFDRLDEATLSSSDMSTNDWIYASKIIGSLRDSYRFLSGEKGQICLDQPNLRDYDGQVSLLQLIAFMSRRGIYYGDVITDNDIRQHEMALSEFRRLHDFISNRARRPTEDHLARLPTFKVRRDALQVRKNELEEVTIQLKAIEDSWNHEETVKYLSAWEKTAQAVSNVAELFGAGS